MKYLVLAAQDLRAASFAIFADDILLAKKDVCVWPEEYLAIINELLQYAKLTLHDIEAVAVVTGPGSFTASRLTVTLANTLGLANHWPIYALSNEARSAIEEWWPKFLADPEAYRVKEAMPTYDRPPHITQPKIKLD